MCFVDVAMQDRCAAGVSQPERVMAEVRDVATTGIVHIQHRDQTNIGSRSEQDVVKGELVSPSNLDIDRANANCEDARTTKSHDGMRGDQAERFKIGSFWRDMGISAGVEEERRLRQAPNGYARGRICD